MDFMGPFTPSSRRNRYIILAVDHLSKWTEVRPVKSATSTVPAHFFYEQIILKHGVPLVMIRDQDSHFLGKFMQEVFQLFGTKHNTTTAYNPKVDGLTERMNGVFKKAISHYTNIKHRNWDDVIPLVTFSPNTMKQGTTLYSPFERVYGREPRTPIDSALSFNGFNHMDNAAQYGRLISEWLEQAREVAKVRANHAHDRVAPRFNSARLDCHFEVGDLVLLQSPPKLSEDDLHGSTQLRGLTTKFYPKIAWALEGAREIRACQLQNKKYPGQTPNSGSSRTKTETILRKTRRGSGGTTTTLSCSGGTTFTKRSTGG